MPTLYPRSSTVDACPKDVANVVAAALSLLILFTPPIPFPEAVTMGNVNDGGSHLLSPVS